ncbi:hypothetical protein A3740_18475 [Oleiphilus sp. HI0068]|jgi:hypothetical protein|uniref:hypothetical protein n=1 Tax=unclassified Oleiphilus TaxID=2631174 RepID=UPI0007C33505|nr:MULTISPECIES: hypothetical protein [unclassified Oleiphilus]KZY73683.1 hypothetical protein A3740_18475 [Oleiphilus sp. HI0068]KZY78233.1 hypothetical protein A3741_08680 [Oleiphilus sp. HI0069]KZZ47461.1 hypothetical protein A3755_15495 [Oleiphilus sp. HI0085]KZY58064.1 hypothetical protein A3735_18035 [Oleiphilus sp. HI0061]KZZ79916.1 hypothetical protein A3766_09675 [Oleiphilus sp. HI0132]
MKWVFIALLVVNVGLVAFQWVKHREQGVSPEFQENKAVKRIVLLSDISSSGGDKQAIARRCELLGPFDNRAELELEKKRVLLGTGEVQIVGQTLDKAPSYWVYIAKKDVVEDLEQRLLEIKVDTYKISSGELSGAYSLGVFENIDLARGLAKKVKKSGMAPSIFEKKKSETSFWLEYGLDYAAENQEKIDEIAALLSTGAKKREIFCKSVASEK